MDDIDKRTRKKSHWRYVQLNKTHKFFNYEKPIHYNLPPIRNQSETGSYSRLGTRRTDNLARAREQINNLVLANTDFSKSAPRFVTFTFAKNVTNLRTANEMWQNFMRKFRKQSPNLKYLCVVEFQKRGSVHYHVLFFNLRFKKGIKETIRTLWGHGFIKFKSAKRIEKIEHLGLYLAKYLQKKIMDIRLRGEKAYFCSKNLTKPTVYRNEQVCEFNYSFYLPMGATIETYQSKHYGTIKKITIKTC